MGGGAVSGFLSGGCEISPEMRSGGRQTPKKLRGVRPDRGAPPETAYVFDIYFHQNLFPALYSPNYNANNFSLVYSYLPLSALIWILVTNRAHLS